MIKHQQQIDSLNKSLSQAWSAFSKLHDELQLGKELPKKYLRLSARGFNHLIKLKNKLNNL